MLTKERIVPISNFNKEGATKIFEEVKKIGTKYVFKNNLPECVLISPEKYDSLLEQLYDMELYVEAVERINRPKEKVYSFEEVMNIFNISQKDLENAEVDME